MVCLLDWRLCCLKVTVYWTLTDKKNHKSQNDQIQFWKSENHKIENKSIDGKLIIFKLVNRKLIDCIYTKYIIICIMGIFIPDFTAYFK